MILEDLAKMLNNRLEEGFPWDAEVFAISKESEQTFNNLESVTFSIIGDAENNKKSSVVLKFKNSEF